MSTKVRLNDVLSINEKLFARKLADEGRALAYKFMLRPEVNEADLTELDLKGVKIVVATRAAEIVNALPNGRPQQQHRYRRLGLRPPRAEGGLRLTEQPRIGFATRTRHVQLRHAYREIHVLRITRQRGPHGARRLVHSPRLARCCRQSFENGQVASGQKWRGVRNRSEQRSRCQHSERQGIRRGRRTLKSVTEYFHRARKGRKVACMLRVITFTRYRQNHTCNRQTQFCPQQRKRLTPRDDLHRFRPQQHN